MREEGLFTIGVIIGPHGRFGKQKVHPMTDYIHRFFDLKEVYLELGERQELFVIRGASLHKSYVLLDFQGIHSRDKAMEYKNFYLKIPEEDLVDLPEGHYFFHEILGLLVLTDKGERLGTVKDILKTGSNDVYVVEGEREVLIPAIHQVVQEIDLEKGMMRVHLLEGLLT